MAHQWFGDLVTMAWWDDIWLNEGFATWMETKPLKAGDRSGAWTWTRFARISGRMDVDALRSTRPIRAPAKTPAEINEVFDAIAYKKGAAVLRMVEIYVGEDAFRHAVNAYLAKYQYGNATAVDFWTTIAGDTGKPVDRIMQSFVSAPGVPVVSVETSCAGAATTVTATQSRYRPAGSSIPASNAPWEIPICMRGPVSNGQHSCSVLASASQVFDRAGCEPWVVVNAGGAGYYRSGYTPDALAHLERAILDVSEPERLMLSSDTWALVRAGQDDVGTYLSLAAALATDRTSAVVRTVSDSLDFISRYLTTDADRDAYRAWIRRTFDPMLAGLGWNPPASEPDDRRQLRAEVVTFLADSAAIPTCCDELTLWCRRRLSGMTAPTARS